MYLQINKAYAAALLAVLFCGVSCGESSVGESEPAMFRGNAMHTGVYETTGVDNLGGLLWKFETAGPVRSSPVIANGTVYVGSTDGHLYALDRETGTERWSVGVGSPISSSPAVSGGLVVFGARDGVFHAVVSQSGSERWRVDTGELIPWYWGFEGWDVYTSSPVIQDSIVVFGAGDGVVYALLLNSGEELWRFATEARIRATPAIADGVVYAGSADGRAYALDLATGAEVWRFETDGVGISSEEQGVDRRSIIASPAVYDGTVYVGSRDGFMYALEQATGTEKFRISHDGSWAMSSPALRGNMLYAGTSDGRFLHEVDVTSGEELWRFVGEGYTWSSPSLAGSTAYIGDGAGYLRAISLESGTERWSFRTSDGVYSSPAVDDGVVFFGADDGFVYALHGDGQYAHRAVFWDEEFAPFMYFRSHVETRVYFEKLGYEVLNANALPEFLNDRLEDGKPSVVVFAMGHLPASVGAEASDTVLFSKYLQSGGKVVWLDIPPMALARDDEGRITAFDRGRSTSLLGVDHSEFNFDFYASVPTELGQTWGLSNGWVSAYSIAVSDSIEVLALDENGRAGAWVKSYGGPPGTGYVAIGMDHVSPAALDAVRSVAEFGLTPGSQ